MYFVITAGFWNNRRPRWQLFSPSPQVVSGVTQRWWHCQTPSSSTSNWTPAWPTPSWSTSVCWTSTRSQSQHATLASSAPSVSVGDAHAQFLILFSGNARVAAGSRCPGAACLQGFTLVAASLPRLHVAFFLSWGKVKYEKREEIFANIFCSLDSDLVWGFSQIWIEIFCLMARVQRD